MENRIAIIGIIVNDRSAVESVNSLLHEHRANIKGRLGLPYESRNISVICIVMDAPGDIINALTGKLGMIEGIKAKTMYE